MEDQKYVDKELEPLWGPLIFQIDKIVRERRSDSIRTALGNNLDNYAKLLQIQIQSIPLDSHFFSNCLECGPGSASPTTSCGPLLHQHLGSPKELEGEILSSNDEGDFLSPPGNPMSPLLSDYNTDVLGYIPDEDTAFSPQYSGVLNADSLLDDGICYYPSTSPSNQLQQLEAIVSKHSQPLHSLTQAQYHSSRRQEAVYQLQDLEDELGHLQRTRDIEKRFTRVPASRQSIHGRAVRRDRDHKARKTSQLAIPYTHPPDLTHRGQKTSSAEKHKKFLQRFSEAVAKPEAFQQMSKSLEHIRNANGINFNISDISSDPEDLCFRIARIMEKLDDPDAPAIFRRFNLLMLFLHRQALDRSFSDRRESNSRHEDISFSGKVSTRSISEIMLKLCPGDHINTDSWTKRRKTLMNRLSAAKNWHLLAEKGGPTLIMLVPSRGTYSLQNQSLEIVPSHQFQETLDDLFEVRGLFLNSVINQLKPHVNQILSRKDQTTRFSFEVHPEQLEKVIPDSPDLVVLCNPEVV